MFGKYTQFWGGLNQKTDPAAIDVIQFHTRPGVAGPLQVLNIVAYAHTMYPILNLTTHYVNITDAMYS